MTAKDKICKNCGHGRNGHIDKWGGICVGCPCPGFEPVDAAESLPAQPKPKRKPITPCVGDPAGTGFCEFNECENDCQSVESLPVEAKEKCSLICPDELSLKCILEMGHYQEYHSDGHTDWITASPVAESKPTPSTPALDLVERIAAYVESESECLMPIVVEETKRAYGVRLLKVMADEIREKFKPQPASISSDQLAWKTIEFAPKDGSVFLGRKHNQVYMTQSSRHYVKFPHEDGGPTFRDVWNQIHPDAVYVWNPTHWIELDIWAAAKGSTDTEGR